MSEDSRIPYHEIDFLLPVHRFNIGFSYLSKRGLPFMREFVLRLIHLAPMSPNNLAEFLGLSERETDEALRDLLEKNEIEYLNDGTVGLTKLAKSYFNGPGDSPQVATVQQTQYTFAFELAGFNCIGSKRTNDKWRVGLALKVPSEHAGLSDQYANEGFQKQFYKLLDKGFMKHVVDPDKNSYPSIYKMDSVTRIGTEPKRINQTFSIDNQGNILEREELEGFDNAEPIIEAITTSLNQRQCSNNIDLVRKAAQAVSEDLYSKFVTSESIDFHGLLIDIAKSMSNDSIKQFFLGPVYAPGNWKRIENDLTPIFDNFEKTYQDGVPELLWLAPSDPYWALSENFLSVKSQLFNRATTNGKNPKPIFSPKLYLPLSGKDDRNGVNQWKHQLGNVDNCYGYTEGFLYGVTEALVIPGQFAVICFHLSNPEISPVSIPVGYFTRDQTLVSEIASLASGYLGETQSFDNPVELGLISKL